MVDTYAGSRYIGTQPTSFKRDPEDEFVDAERQRWLEESGKLRDDQKAQTREGSVFMEYDDPTAPGGKRYVARRKSQVPQLNQGAGITGDALGGGETEYRYTDPSGKQQSHRGRIMSFKGETGRDEQFITEDKKYGNKKFTNREFEQYGKEFSDYKTKSADEAERLKRKTEADAESNRRYELEQKSKDADVQRAINARRGIAGVDREIAQADPNYESDRAQKAEEAAARMEALRAQTEALRAGAKETAYERGIRERSRTGAAAYAPKTQAGKLAFQREMEATADPMSARQLAMAADKDAIEKGQQVRVGSFIEDVREFAKKDDAVFGADPTGEDVETLVGSAAELRNYMRDNLGMDNITAAAAILNAYRKGKGDISDNMLTVLERRLKESL